MSTSAVYSPHQPSSSTLPTTSESTVLTSTRYSRGRSATNLQRANSSSPPPRPKLTRAQRSQSTKEQSPDKMSASSSRASAAHASASDDAVEAQVALDTGLDTNKQHDDDRMDADEEGEPELDNLDHDIEPETADSPAAGDESAMDEVPDAPAEAAAPHQKIMLVIARKRKVDDDTTTVSSEVGLDTPANAATPGTSDLPGAEEPAGEAVGDDGKPPAKAPSGASEGVHATDATAATSTSTTDAEAEAAATAAAVAAAAAAAEAEAAKPRRAPRKRRKWLRKGEVDPDDPKAVAEQKARHALIDAALVALDEQENLVLDGTHPTLIALWEELDRRRDLLRSRLDTEIELELAELEGFRKERINQTHFQFHADCEDLALELMFENRRKMSRLVAEKTYLDRHKASTKRKYTNMPTLGEGRGSGGWPVPTSKLLSNGTEPTVETFVDGESRERRDVVLGVKPIAEDDLEDDLVRMGIIPRPEKIRPSPEPAVRPLVYAEAELAPRSWSRPPTQDPTYASNKAPFARQPSATTAPAYPENKAYATAEPAYRRPSPPQVPNAVASAPPPPPQLGRSREFDVYRQRSSDNVEPEREILPAPRLFDRPPAPRHPGPFDAPPPHWINNPRDPRAEPPLAPPPRTDPRDIRADLRDPRADQRVDPRVDPRADHHIDPRVDPRVDPRGDPRDLRHEPLADPRNLRGDPRDPRGAPPPPSRYDDPPGGWWGSSRAVPPPPVPYHERSHSGRFAPPPPPPPPGAGLGSGRHPPPPPMPSSGGPPAGDPYFWGNDWNGAPPPRDYYARDRYGHPPPDQGRMYPQGSSTPAAYATSRGP